MQTTLPLRQIADDVFVAPQLDAAAMAELARLGFKSVVNNRPDFEHGPNPPTPATGVSAAPPLAAPAMGELPRLGFKSVVNNRPDFEHGPNQPTSAQVEAAAVLEV